MLRSRVREVGLNSNIYKWVSMYVYIYSVITLALPVVDFFLKKIAMTVTLLPS